MRTAGSQGGVDAVGHPDVHGLADHRVDAHVCIDRPRRARAAADRATAAGLQCRRRVRHQRDLHERDRDRGQPRLLFRHSLRHAHHGPAAGARRADGPAIRWCSTPSNSKRGAGAFHSPSARSPRSAGCTCDETWRKPKRSRRSGQRRARPASSPTAATSARSAHRHRPDDGRHAVLLHLHHVHAEIPGRTRSGSSKNESTLVSTANLFVFMLLQPLMGALSDRFGRRPMLIVFGVLALFATVPLLSALAQARMPGPRSS